jgi:hypothetical protein
MWIAATAVTGPSAAPTRAGIVDRAARGVLERLGRPVERATARRAATAVARGETLTPALARPCVPRAVHARPIAEAGAQWPGTINSRSGIAVPKPTATATERLSTVERFGDEAMGFVWRDKGALAVSTALASFLAKPEAFLGVSRQSSPGITDHGGTVNGLAEVILGRLRRIALVLAAAMLVPPLLAFGPWAGFALVRLRHHRSR